MGTCRPAGTTACPAGDDRGFSLVELVVVLAVAGLLAAVAAPRFFGAGVFAERAWFDEVTGALRYARTLAVGSGCAVRVTLTATTYVLEQQAASGGHCDAGDSTWPTAVRLPDGQTASGSAPAGVSLAPGATIVFDAAGRTNLGSDLTITIGARTLTVRAGSGFVTS